SSVSPGQSPSSTTSTVSTGSGSRPSLGTFVSRESPVRSSSRCSSATTSARTACSPRVSMCATSCRCVTTRCAPTPPRLIPTSTSIIRHLRAQRAPGQQLHQLLQPYDEPHDRLLTTRIDVRDFLQVRDDALRAHATQVDPDGAFFRIPHEVERAAWGTDDYELHLSRIGVQLPETDLFAGLRVDAEQLAGART